MIICAITFEDFIEALVCEGPETICGSEITYLVKNMSNPMVIRFYVDFVQLSSFGKLI